MFRDPAASYAKALELCPEGKLVAPAPFGRSLFVVRWSAPFTLVAAIAPASSTRTLSSLDSQGRPFPGAAIAVTSIPRSQAARRLPLAVCADMVDPKTGVSRVAHFEIFLSHPPSAIPAAAAAGIQVARSPRAPTDAS